MIRLDPAELGHVQIRIDRPADGPAHVVLAVERSDTLMLLLQDRPHLNQALDAAGVPPEGRTLQFDLTPGGDGAGQDRAPRGDGQRSGQGFGGNRAAPDDSGGPPIPTPRRPVWTRTGIDITA